MSFAAITQSSEKLIEGWGEIPVSYDNVAFDKVPEASWCRTYVVDGDSFSTAIGDRCIRMTGLVIVQIFTPTLLGSTQAREIADSLTNLFINKRDGDIQYYVPYVTRVGYIDKIYQLNLSVPFQMDSPVPVPAPVTYLGSLVTHNSDKVTYGII